MEKKEYDPKNSASDGNGGVDPTKNVLQLVEAAVTRLNDLRDAETKRIDQLREAESRRVDEQADIRERHVTQLREAEAKRIDAIRAVDVAAVAVASSRASDQAAVLATQLVTTADTLRALVTAQATALATQLTQLITPITDRLGLLEKAQYTGAGKEGVTDPLMKELLTEMKAVRESQNTSTGKGAGLHAGWLYLLGGLSFFSTIVALFVVFSPR